MNQKFEKFVEVIKNLSAAQKVKVISEAGHVVDYHDDKNILEKFVKINLHFNIIDNAEYITDSDVRVQTLEVKAFDKLNELIELAEDMHISIQDESHYHQRFQKLSCSKNCWINTEKGFLKGKIIFKYSIYQDTESHYKDFYNFIKNYAPRLDLKTTSSDAKAIPIM